MPADSDPTPEAGATTWRPIGARIAGALSILTLVVVCAVAWWALGPEIRSHFTTAQRITLVVLFGMLFAAWWAMARSRLIAAADGVTVVNGYRTRHYEWAEVIAFRLRRGAPWAELDLADGESLAVFAVQGSDGDRARTAVTEFRTLLARHEPPDR